MYKGSEKDIELKRIFKRMKNLIQVEYEDPYFSNKMIDILDKLKTVKSEHLLPKDKF